jgi:hypothetical protein
MPPITGVDLRGSLKSWRSKRKAVEAEYKNNFERPENEK